MNIAIAAHYMKIGYRVRRTSWEPEEYLCELASMFQKAEVRYSNNWNHESKAFDTKRYVSVHTGYDAISFGDLLAEDWEIITSNIRREFNKYGSFEYQDEEDWDNYEPKGWGEEDE
jgi:hypothetical protein